MKQLRILFFLITLSVLVSFSNREALVARFDTEENHLIMDDTIIRKYHRLPGFISTYGEPDLKKTEADGISQKHYYESLGIVLDVRYGSIRGITFKFNNSNDTNLTKNLFSGTLSIDEKVLSATSKESDLKKIKYFECGRPGACYSAEFGTEVTVFAMFDKTGKKTLKSVSFVY